MNRLMWLSLAFICAGAFGNLIDRLFRDGIVIDFLHFPFLDFIVRFSCNIADVCLTAGGILLAIELLFFYKGKEGDRDAKTPANSDTGV